MNKPKTIKDILADKWIEGRVVKGKGRGRRLGFPTINIVCQDLKISFGVYVCKAKINKFIYHGLLFFGPRPTFNEKSPSLEIFLLNFNQEISPGTKIEFQVSKFLRKVKRFNNKEELVEQIKSDIQFIYQVASGLQ